MFAKQENAWMVKDDQYSAKDWALIGLAVIFIVLYASALAGWLRPIGDVLMIARLEPLIFLIIGYYFGRVPARRHEKALKEEIDLQTRRADAAIYVKEQIQKDLDVLEEKVNNARSALKVEKLCEGLIESPSFSNPTGPVALPEKRSTVYRPVLLHRSIETVRRILGS